MPWDEVLLALAEAQEIEADGTGEMIRLLRAMTGG
jgi:hypothetical protein